MTDAAAGEVPVTFAKGLLDDVAELTATTAEDSQVVDLTDPTVLGVNELNDSRAIVTWNLNDCQIESERLSDDWALP